MKTKINIRIDEDDNAALQGHAKKEGLSFSELLRRIIKEFLEKIKDD